ncbi:hypothetical protein VHUM_02526 [Vanrija humicola]|uniref:Golgi apparatus membrane protein TVP38 n=1 Tax=Vanrija humicola TaxID=5417 RepID=A0A7D8V0F8_VANHU|nr:hypothetical protein VHUM_02526 [Vanrija humicola]
MVLDAVRERLCGSKGGALGRGLIIGWVLTTLGFLAATAFWKGELFSALDNLSKNLYEMGYQGLLVFGVLIFITTIPPLPLYSTLIVLSGYTFGVWYGFVASYIASLVGAVVVFVVSRTLLRDTVTKCLASSPTATSLLQIIPQNPHLLLLIRVAPYPYNLLNVVLASAPTLSLQTYTACTALSLCKLVLHTWIGAGIHDLSAAYNAGGSVQTEPSEEDIHRDRIKAGATWGGIVLCVLLFVYLTHIAKREIAKAQDEQRVVREEEVAFLTPMGEARDCDEDSAC